jgi:hypothetical protein
VVTAPMRLVESAQAAAGRGFVGDCYVARREPSATRPGEVLDDLLLGRGSGICDAVRAGQAVGKLDGAACGTQPAATNDQRPWGWVSVRNARDALAG